MLAGEVFDRVAVLLNDVNKDLFTNAQQLPYLNIAIDDLVEEMEQNNVPTTNKKSGVIQIKAGVLGIGIDSSTPNLPNDLVEIQKLMERQSGTNNDFIDMTRFEFLPEVVAQTTFLMYWSWIEQVIRFVGATSDIDVKIEYISRIVIPVVNANSLINVINSKSYLAYRTAALCSEFVGENPTRALDLNEQAELAKIRFINLSTKGRQVMATRRRPFMASFKSRMGI